MFQNSENAETMKSLLRKLQDKDEDLLNQADRYDAEINKLNKEIHNLKTELSKVQRELQVIIRSLSGSIKINFGCLMYNEQILYLID